MIWIILILVLLYCTIRFAQKYFFICCGVIATPIIKLYIKYITSIEKVPTNRYKEYFGITNVMCNSKSIFWVHASGIGEARSALSLIKILSKYCEKIVLTTTDPETILALKKLPGNVIHQFVPLDALCYVKRFIKYWNPRAMFLIESDIFPNMLYCLKDNKIPCYMINMRISEKTKHRYYTIAKLFHILPYKLFDFICTPLQENIDVAKKLGARNVCSMPNLKLLSDKLQCDQTISAILQKLLYNKQTWAATSIKPEEEKIIFDVNKKLLENNNNIVVIIAPRHIDRITYIKNLCQEYNMTYTLYSELQNVSQCNNVIIVDSIGVLGSIFDVVKTVFVGGSMLCAYHGHNAIEPIKFDCQVVTGPYIHNFRDVYNDLQNNWEIVYSQYELFLFLQNKMQCNTCNTIHIDFEQFVKKWENTIDQLVQNIK